MHAGVAALLHAGTRGLGGWSLEPGVAGPLALVGVLYVSGLRRIAGRRRHAGRRLPLLAFGAGWATLLVALCSPLHEASESSFSAHMIQHELLMVVAAPLLVMARPLSVIMHGLPASLRDPLGGLLASPGARAAWRALIRPMNAWLLHGAAIWLWHIPLLFQATLHSELAHGLQHLSFFGSGVLFWWSVVHTRRSAQGLAVIYLFTTTVHTGVLGALLTFSRQPWYPEYALGATRWGMTPLMDQQLAGMIMWIPASVAYLLAALAMIRRWLASSAWAVEHRERAAAAL